MNWSKYHKDRNWDNAMFLDKRIFYLKVPVGMRWMMKNEQYAMPRINYNNKINFLVLFPQKEK